jgi:coenzyme PQQ biosynthesis protein C
LVLNRYYYQSCIPIKDAIILSKSDDAAFRRAWRKRIIDHDGNAGVGGIEKWLRLADAAGLERDCVIGGHAILPGVRYAVDAYLNLVREGTLLEAVSSSLTELFAGNLIALRMDALAKYYPWLQHGLTYFQGRLTQAPEDAAFAFEYAAEHATTPQLQALVIRGPGFSSGRSSART